MFLETTRRVVPSADMIVAIAHFYSIDFYVYSLVCSLSSVINDHTLYLHSLTTSGSCLLEHDNRRPPPELPISLTPLHATSVPVTVYNNAVFHPGSFGSAPPSARNGCELVDR